MKSYIYTAIVLVSLSAYLPPTSAQGGRPNSVIVELFTSEGCENCPAADKYLGELLTKQPIEGVEIIALALHVDYWNRLGWADPFSSAQFSKRQGYYSAFFKHTETFTPQFVIDGGRELSGRDGSKALIAAANNPKGRVAVKIQNEKDTIISIKVKVDKLPQITMGDQALVLLAVVEDDLNSKPSSGENSGQKLKHVAVARYLKTVGEVRNEGATLAADITLGKDWKRHDLSIIAFVQEAKSRRIIGAAKIEL
ncbi:MAG: DUF1223 domain-containing protein [Saprospiraceae bacterium]|nr:DUF1223 domain-containing protein [Pyrinomonadaceae bacterium]